MCIDDRFTLPSIIFKGKNCVNEFIAWVLKKQKWSEQIIKHYFNKKIIMAMKMKKFLIIHTYVGYAEKN